MPSKFDISALMNSPTTPTDQPLHSLVASELPSCTPASPPRIDAAISLPLSSCGSSQHSQYNPSQIRADLVDFGALSRSAHLLENRTGGDSGYSSSSSLTSSPPSPSASFASLNSVPPFEGSIGNSSKPKRRRATKEQLKTLNDVLQRTYFPSTELRLQLATKLNMPPRSVQIWFQNQRQTMRQTCPGDDKASGLIDGRKRKHSPSDNFSLNGEDNELEMKDVTAQPKKPKSVDGEAYRNQESRDLSSEPSLPYTTGVYQSPRSIPSISRVASWLDHSATAPLLPLPTPKVYPHYSSSSLQHFVSSPSHPGVFTPFNSQINTIPCLNPKIPSMFPSLPSLPPALTQ